MQLCKISPSELQKRIYSHAIPSGKHEVIKLNKLKTMIGRFMGSGGKRILDLGCGDGSLLESFCKENECHGIDISREALQIARRKGYKIYEQDLETERLPFIDEYFDMVVFSEVMEHIVNTEHFINEINRVIHKNGVLVMSFPNTNQPISYFMSAFLDIPPMYSARIYSPHVRDLTLKLMKKLLRIKGFNVLHVEGTYVYPFKSRLSQFIARKIPRLGEKLILAAEKEKVSTSLPSVIWDIRELLSNY